MPVSRPKLLLADDSITIQKVVNLTFGDQGMEVFAFSDGDSAIARFDEIKPDVVLADVHMPGMSGYRLCELVRSNEASPDTPVLLLVGSFEPFDQDEAARVGASGHMTKPFSSIADLISTVEDLVKSAPALSATDEPKPDTTDIDSLYEQSFVETVEIPKNGTSEGTYEFGGLDDEMIQTSYASDAETEETFYAVDESDEKVGFGGEEDVAAPESLIAESVPAESLDEPVNEEKIESPPAVSDPFESVAAEPAPTTVDRAPEEITFSADDTDLLEIPGAVSRQESNASEPSVAPSEAANAFDLSPELIDLIVNKVVERLEQKAKTGAAHSVSGS